MCVCVCMLWGGGLAEEAAAECVALQVIGSSVPLACSGVGEGESAEGV